MSRRQEIIWSETQQTILESSGVSTDPKMSRYRKSILRYRAKPLACSDGPYQYIRSKLLYTLMPSDGTFWTTLKDPTCWVIRIMMVMPVLSVIVFAALLLMIERRDEFQLVNYITMAKSFQAIAVGVVPLVSEACAAQTVARGMLMRVAAAICRRGRCPWSTTAPIVPSVWLTSRRWPHTPGADCRSRRDQAVRVLQADRQRRPE